MNRHEIEIRFECVGSHDISSGAYVQSMTVIVKGQPNVERAISWARERFKLPAEDYPVASVTNGRLV